MAKLDASQLAKALEQPGLQMAILLPQNPTFDAVAAATGLCLSVEKAGRKAVVAGSDPMTVEFHRLVGANSVATDFGSRNLVISFPGQTEAVDKVSYNVEAGELQLVVTPKVGAILDHTKLKFVPGSMTADVVVLVGVRDVADLGKIYADAKNVIDVADQFWLDGQVLSQTVTQLIQQLRLTVNADAASNLLAGLQQATNHYQSSLVSADTFEVAAWLMRQGANRQEVASPAQYPAGSIPISTPTPVIDQTPEPDWYEPKIYRGTSVS